MQESIFKPVIVSNLPNRENPPSGLAVAERADSKVILGSSLEMQAMVRELADTRGVYRARCIGPDSEHDRRRLSENVAAEIARARGGRVPDNINEIVAKTLGIKLSEKWAEEFVNTLVTVGKNVILDQALAGSAYTVTGPYMGLISSVSYSAIAAADTMSSHAGWTEAGVTNAPTYTTPRKTPAWSSASAGSKAMSAALSFSFTGTGTVKGAFMVFFTGAVTTIDNTSGTLLSAGLFGTGDRAVLSGDTLNVSWSLAL